MSDAAQILLVGCGKMGGALLEGWLGSVLPPARVTVVETNDDLRAALPRRPQVELVAREEDIPADCAPDVVLLAVKPQSLAETLSHYARFDGPTTVFLSIAAGKNIAFFQQHLGAQAAVVRAMPNTPAAVGRGVCALYANANVTADQRDTCYRLMADLSDVFWVEDEAMMDVVTAISGGGPAYVFLLIEALTQAAIAEGMPDSLASRIARATVMGSAELARQSSDQTAAELRQAVASPGGTTEAALKVLMAEGSGLESLMTQAVKAARQRALELSQ